MRTPGWARRARGGTLHGTVAALGFRRVDEVRIVDDGENAWGEVTGVTHRLPHTVRVSLATAGRLVAAGVPVRFDSPEHRAGTTA